MELLWLGQPNSYDVSLVGGKVANLSRLASHEQVPPGFCLTTAAFSRWASELKQPNAAVPVSLWAMLSGAYDQLAELSQIDEFAVAVRSSAVDEDGKEASFAGQYQTYLNVIGKDAILAAVIDCWRTVDAERVIAYRQQRGLPTENISLAVFVQQMIHADSSAIAFSANPVTNNQSEILINANWGLGESIVNGMVTPDTFIVRKSDGLITTEKIAKKQKMTISSVDGVKEVNIPQFLIEQPSLTKPQILEIAKMSSQLEERMGWPVDVECAYASDQLYLLQCRPITTLC